MNRGPIKRIPLYCGRRLMESHIMVYIWLIESNNPDLQAPNYSFIPRTGWSSFTYCYHSVNGISYGLAQSDPMKHRPLYLKPHGEISFMDIYFVNKNDYANLSRPILS